MPRSDTHFEQFEYKVSDSRFSSMFVTMTTSLLVDTYVYLFIHAIHGFSHISLLRKMAYLIM